ncbi:uncharacterized protein LOC125473354 [Pyrus x bretschneideri]|uniref:uncharacterized protein LOC125473354 n=1 Tax=Pyrus x bretschneideri TaxID=225117 RepID=UPI00202EE286|nr:uncharacterized protein LOC125473354 [Pyrus x bretschneideri]
MDIIGKITLSSGSAKHAWILVATDYFTKWVEAKSYIELTSKNVCNFVEENIMTRFSILEKIITNNGTIFTTKRFKEYAMSLKIRLDQSTLYYPQANGQAGASNKVLIGTTLYALTYAHDAMLPVKLSINSLRVIEQISLFSAEYSQAMRQKLENLEEARLDAYYLLVAQKKIAQRTYN